jgi:hypothetical protein
LIVARKGKCGSCTGKRCEGIRREEEQARASAGAVQGRGVRGSGKRKNRQEQVQELYREEV